FGTAVTDAGLANFKGCKELSSLRLDNTQVTDGGLAYFKECKSLTGLQVRQTKVTAKGLAEFHAAVPRCQIDHDGGTIEAIDVDRKAAEYVLSVSGIVKVNGEDRDIKGAADLPKGRLILTRADFVGSQAVTDAGLAV